MPSTLLQTPEISALVHEPLDYYLRMVYPSHTVIENGDWTAGVYVCGILLNLRNSKKWCEQLICKGDWFFDSKKRIITAFLMLRPENN